MKTKSRAGKARTKNGPSKRVGSGRLVRLLCRKCGAKTYTKRESYEPEAVKTVVCVCLKCDNGGGFDDLQYLDAKGRDLGDIYAKPNKKDDTDAHST